MTGDVCVCVEVVSREVKRSILQICFGVVEGTMTDLLRVIHLKKKTINADLNVIIFLFCEIFRIF